MANSSVTSTFTVQAKHADGQWWTVCTDTVEAAAQATANYISRRYEVETRVVTEAEAPAPAEQSVEQPAPTSLEQALLKAGRLSDPELYALSGKHAGTAAGCACFLELASRKRAADRDAELKAIFA